MNLTDLHTSSRTKARFEIIPLIDVVFFLLATFVLFTLSLEKIGALLIPLPRSEIVIERQDDTTLYVQALEQGAVDWKVGRSAPAEFVSATEVHARMVDYRRRFPSPRVFVSGDGRARFGATVKLLDEARLAGLTEISVETAPNAFGN